MGLDGVGVIESLPLQAGFSILGAFLTPQIFSPAHESLSFPNGDHKIYMFLKPHNGIFGLLQPFIKNYKEFKIFFHRYVYNSLTLGPKLHAPKIDETCPNCSRIVHENSNVFIFESQ